MIITANTNISSIKAQDILSKNTSSLIFSYNNLSDGLKINNYISNSKIEIPSLLKNDQFIANFAKKRCGACDIKSSTNGDILSKLFNALGNIQNNAQKFVL